MIEGLVYGPRSSNSLWSLWLLCCYEATVSIS